MVIIEMENGAKIKIELDRTAAPNTVKTRKGEYHIKKAEYADLGLEFSTGMMSGVRMCCGRMPILSRRWISSQRRTERSSGISCTPGAG